MSKSINLVFQHLTKIIIAGQANYKRNNSTFVIDEDKGKFKTLDITLVCEQKFF